MPLAPWQRMRALVRWLLVVLVVLGCVGCVYSRKKQVGTNLPPGDLGGPWTKGEQTGGGGGGPAFTPGHP